MAGRMAAETVTQQAASWVEQSAVVMVVVPAVVLAGWRDDG